MAFLGHQIRCSDEASPPTSERTDTTDNALQDREILLSDINNMIEACGRLTAEIAGEVARMQAEDLEMERLDACRVGLQGAPYSASRN